MSLPEETWFPGVLLGGYCLIYSLTIGGLAARKAARGLAYGLHYGMWALCCGLLLAGFGLFFAGKAPGLWQAYGMAGGLGAFVALGMGVALKGLYR